MKLLAARFDSSDTSAALLEQFDDVQSAGLDWSVDDFGVTRIEITVKANGSYDAFDRYSNHHGQRLALYTEDLYQPVSGRIYEVEWLAGDLIKYIAYGPNFDMERAYIVKRFLATDTITSAITYITSRIPVCDSDVSNIVTNAITLDGWNPDYPAGSYPTEAIQQLLNMSDSSNRIYDFRMIDKPLSGVNLGQYTPHYTYRNIAALPDWVISREDLSAGGLRLSRNIQDFANIVRVWYGIVEGTSTAVTATSMTDATATFVSDGVRPGDTITNLTKGGRTKITTVTSETVLVHEGWRPKQRGIATGGSTTTLIDTEADFIVDGIIVGDILTNLLDSSLVTTDGIGTITGVAATQLTIAGTMSGGKTNSAGERYEISGPMVAGDTYSIKTAAQTKFAEYQIDNGTLWDKELSIYEPSMNEAQAKQYAKVLTTIKPQQFQSFVISAPFIHDGTGARRNLLDMLSYGGGYIQISDLYPSAAAFSNAINGLTTFWITSMSYDYTTNKLTVDVDTLSRRLDARLRRAKILRVQQIQRYNR